MFGIGRLMLVSVVAFGAFIVALISFRQVPVSQCEMAAVRDPSYSITLVEHPSVNLTLYHIVVTHNGAPVNRATVCARADMGGPGGMSGMGTSDEAHQVGPGRYQVTLQFQMGGAWQGQIVVLQPGQPPVGDPLSVNAT